MPFAALLVLALGLSLLGTLFNLPQRVVDAAPARPDIVMFYMDDFAPYPSRMWDREARTPELARFADQGLEFENAIASTPLCGPSRANLLTGKYSHNNGVTKNDIRPYKPRNSVPVKLGNKGYKTVFVGKHINRLAKEYPSRRSMRRLSSNWDRFDAIWENQGKFYDWRQYRKNGTRSYGNGAYSHSSYRAAQRAVKHIKSTPRGQPLFLVVSLVDGHIPMTPMKRFRNHPSCQIMAPWDGPAFNEADVSDKPEHIRKTPRLSEPSYGLRKRCEQALTVDWVVGQVRKELKQRGRVDNTLQILTSDNGWLMGDHRLEGKVHPYATPVPLYMRWPAVLGDEKRVIREPVSNVDFGRTFCALAGCTMPASDGKNLVPLIKGRKERIDRRYLYTEMLHASRWFGRRPSARPAWSGVETTLGYSNTLWAFTRYRTGEEELYDISADPHRLENLAGNPAYADVLADLRGFRNQVWDRDRVKWRTKLSL